MRWRCRILCHFCLLFTIILFLSLYYKQEAEKTLCPPNRPYNDNSKETVLPISCIIDGGRQLPCLRHSGTSEIYLPFYSFIQKTFDISGQIVKQENEDVFEWWYSYAKVHPAPKMYSPNGVFGPFGAYNVEGRDRVKCISPITGVPMSTQWDPLPYYYPVQIAQFGLEHYSKNITDHEPRYLPIRHSDIPWKADDPGKQKIMVGEETGVEVVEVQSNDYNLGVHINLDDVERKGTDVNLSLLAYPILQFDGMFGDNAGFSVHVRRVDIDQDYSIHYIPKELPDCVKFVAESNELIYGMGPHSPGDWTSISRNIHTDINRGLAALPSLKGKKKLKHQKLAANSIVLNWITFHGSVKIKKLALATSNHYHSFMAAADWFIKHQNEKGGWSVPVKRVLADGKLVLEPEWHSAMAQGHAMSLLVRAFLRTKDRKYLDAARRAVGLFQVNAESGGVRNEFLGVPWFEEYPSVPGTFVLNGFIYSLIGLYDLSFVEKGQEQEKVHSSASTLYLEGMKSLGTLLPLYDTGSGSHYDLRHFSLAGMPPNLARWDYHAVHIYQLMWLSLIHNDNSLFKEMADRWRRYTFGERAKHN